MSGNINKQDILLKHFELSSQSWQVKADNAKTIGKCILIFGKVTIKGQGKTYEGEKFKFCPKTNLLTSQGAVTITNGKFKIKTKELELNLKNNTAKISGIHAEHD